MNTATTERKVGAAVVAGSASSGAGARAMVFFSSTTGVATGLFFGVASVEHAITSERPANSNWCIRISNRFTSSVSGSALDIEYGASLAVRTDEPLAPARVAEAERPAADGARRERHGA